jgi:CHAT domain-containing protein
LTGADLASISRLPTLVFFNACESARVRGRRSGRKSAKQSGRKQRAARTRTQEMINNVGLAEAFMRGGVANFLGTYWPVGDAAAESFARTFYTDVLAGKTLGEALVHGRSVVRGQRSPDWADYIFYGNADFVLKDAV